MGGGAVSSWTLHMSLFHGDSGESKQSLNPDPGSGHSGLTFRFQAG